MQQIDFDCNAGHMAMLNQMTVLEECCVMPGSCRQQSGIWFLVRCFWCGRVAVQGL